MGGLSTGILGLGLMLGLVSACSPSDSPYTLGVSALVTPTPGAQSLEFQVPPPPFSEGVFPCTDCHDPELPVRTERRELHMAHEEIVLLHAEEQRWCLDCHDKGDRDRLRLANGDLVEFEESHRLCGQCHGDKYRDWRSGIHGRRTGRWDGERTYLLCVHCHNSHQPRFPPIEPESPPHRPEPTR